MYQKGKKIWLANHEDNLEIECEITEVDPVDGRIIKLKALRSFPELGKLGFFKEGEDYVMIERTIITQN